MSRLARDVRGNTLALGAAALFPMAGLVGGGIDLSRMYLTKTRMQHACDAGALAGRKAMGGGKWDQSSYMPRTVAEKMYDANFPSDAYGSTGATKTFTENAGVVKGTASTELPMTLMRILGENTRTIAVSCDAEMRLPNTDVMFVLDTTGSMAQIPTGDTRTKMASLKSAVKCFYEVVARLDTSATCSGGAPSGGTGGEVQIRFGFVPYATNVNVGRLLNTAWVADSWSYQTRKLTGGTAWTSWDQYTYHVRPTSGTNKNNCVPPDTDTATRQYKSEDYNYNGTWYCIDYQRTKDVEWNYDLLSQNISGLKNGTGWRTSFALPIGDSGANKTINWEGCIEERQTVKQSSYNPIPSAAYDLDIDMVPTSNNATKWGPVLPDVIYTRQSTGSGNSSSGWSMPAVKSADNFTNTSYYACPTEAKKMQLWPTASAFETYVDSLTPEGNTYHDIGLLWGARLMSQGRADGTGGLFASENKLTPKGGEIQRNLIFMTDGDACTGITNYTAYGVNWFDRRQTDAASAPTDGCTDTGTLTQQVNARMDALCTAIKNKNISLWVIAFGDLQASTENRLKACADSGRYFAPKKDSDLQAAFETIAAQISMLRLTN